MVIEFNSTLQWHISEGDALTSAGKQQLFFKSLDRYKIDVSTSPASQRKTKTEFDAKLETAVKSMPVVIPSDTVVMEAAFYLLRQGLLNIPDVGTINVKQARAFLWNAAWLQEYMSAEWRAKGMLQGCSEKPRQFEHFCLAIIGPGGTGKTAVLKITEALTIFFTGKDTVQKLAPSNAAARILGGDTIHALCRLPFGKAKLTSKKGRLGPIALRTHRKIWENAVSVYMDEISMVSADQFLQSDVRLRQAKMKPEMPFGGMALNVCGDFLQLPPVNKDGNRRSLATATVESEEENDDVNVDDASARQQRRAGKAESMQGLRLWRNIQRVVCLSINVRAPGILSRLQSEMREGRISDAMWDLCMSRVIVPRDARLTTPGSPFVEHNVHFLVH